MTELNPRLYFRIIHSVIRANDTPEEVARANDVCRWVGQNAPYVQEVFDGAGEEGAKRLLEVAWNHWGTFHQPVSLAILTELVEKEDRPGAMQNLLSDYEQFRKDLPATGALDMPSICKDRQEDMERFVVSNVLIDANTIAVGAMAGKKPTDPQWRGPRDAIKFIFQKISEGVLVSDYKVVGEDFDLGIDIALADSRKAAASTVPQVIPTGIDPIDRLMGGIGRREFCGVLGFSGQRKSAVVRNISYNAALAGFQVLHIPLEMSVEDERATFTIMHTFHEDLMPHWRNIDRRRLQEGKLTPEDERYFHTKVIPHWKKSTSKGSLRIKQPSDKTWESIKLLIDIENRVKQLDLVVIDYLSFISLPIGTRDSSDAVNQIIKDAKLFCHEFDNDRGLAIVTPVQGSREGLKAAIEEQGQWRTSGIGKFNEFEKTLDLCLTVWFDDAMKAAGQVRIGSCKARRSDDLPVTTMNMGRTSGVLSATSGPSEEATFEDVWDAYATNAAETAQIGLDA